jgi:hypothetical protein
MSTRKEQKEAARTERLRKEEEAKRAAARRRTLGYVAGGVLALAAIVAVVFALTSGGGGGANKGGSGGKTASFPARSGPLPDPPADLSLASAAKKAGCVYKHEKDEGSNHVQTDVAYKTAPPTSGDHNPNPAEDGAYTEAPRIERLVHSLEHGRIILWYPPNAPDNVKADLKAIFDEDPAHMIVAPYTEPMDYAVAATAWTETLGCKTWNEDAIQAVRAFRDQFRDQGPEFAP